MVLPSSGCGPATAQAAAEPVLAEDLLPRGVDKFKVTTCAHRQASSGPPLDGTVPDASTVLYGRPGDFLVIHRETSFSFIWEKLGLIGCYVLLGFTII